MTTEPSSARPIHEQVAVGRGKKVASADDTVTFLQSKTEKKLRKLQAKAHKKRHPFVVNAPGGIKHLITPGLIRAEIERRGLPV